MNIHRRIREAREAKGISQNAFAKLVGVSAQAVQQWELEKARVTKSGNIIHPTAPKRSNHQRVREVLGVDVFNESILTHAANEPASLYGHVITVSRMRASGSMGPGHDLPEEDQVVQQIRLAENWVRMRLPQLSSPQNLKVISAYGDSMKPTFTDGDLLLIDTGIRAVDIDGVFVLQSNGRLYIKRVSQKLNGTFVVSSDNPLAGTPEELAGHHEINVLGRVVWAWNGRTL